MLVIKGLQQTDQMRRNGKDHEDMKDLMGATEDVESARLPSLWYASLEMISQ